MTGKSVRTGYARLTPLQARAVAAAALAAMVLAVAVTLSPMASSNLAPKPNEKGDVALYRAEADRVHHGEDYYASAAAELASRGYPMRSVFNWRTPLPMWLLGKLPAVEWGKVILGGLALALLLLAFEALAREEDANGGGSTTATPTSMTKTLTEPVAPKAKTPRGRVTATSTSTMRGAMRRLPVVCALLLTGPLLPSVLGDLYVLPALWAGIFIALSACCYGVNRPGLGVAFGLAAVFFRELALPYCVLCAGLAWWHGRRGELAAWMFGLAAWLAFFCFHWWQVSELIPPDARAHRQGWVQFGGAGFVISTAQMNAYLLLFPQGVTAIYLVAAMVGLAGWQTPLGTRMGLTVCLFAITFAVVGQSFNQYWGLLIAPLLCFGAARFPASARDLVAAARTD